MKTFFILWLFTIYAHSSSPPCSWILVCLPLSSQSCIPRHWLFWWYEKYWRPERLLLSCCSTSEHCELYSIFVDWSNCAFLAMDWKIIPSFSQPVVLPSATGLFHGSIYNRILSSKGFFSEDKTKCVFMNSPNVWQGIPVKALIYKESFCQ